MYCELILYVCVTITLTHVYVLCTCRYTRCVHVLLMPTIPISVELVFNKTLQILASLKFAADGEGCCRGSVFIPSVQRIIDTITISSTIHCRFDD